MIHMVLFNGKFICSIENWQQLFSVTEEFFYIADTAVSSKWTEDCDKIN